MNPRMNIASLLAPLPTDAHFLSELSESENEDPTNDDASFEAAQRAINLSSTPNSDHTAFPPTKDSAGLEHEPAAPQSSNPTVGSRRRREEASVEYGGGLDDPDDSDAERQQKRVQTQTGESRSAVSERELRAKIKAGTYVPNEAWYKRWQDDIRRIDPDAILPDRVTRPETLYLAGCSRCGTVPEPQRPGDTSRFRKHVEKTCTGPTLHNQSTKKAKKAGTIAQAQKSATRFAAFFTKVDKTAIPAKKIPAKKTPNPSLPSAPCPGLSELDDTRIPTYVQRTSASGGGSRALYTISQALFGVAFSELKDVEKIQRVLDVQYHERKWSNDHQALRVFSTACKKEVAGAAASKRNLPCASCAALLDLKPFGVALRKRPSEKLKFVPFRFRNTVVGQLFAKYVGLKAILDEVSDVFCSRVEHVVDCGSHRIPSLRLS